MTSPLNRPAEVNELLAQLHNAPKESLEVHSNVYHCGITIGDRKVFAAVDTTMGEASFIAKAATFAPTILDYVAQLEMQQAAAVSLEDAETARDAVLTELSNDPAWDQVALTAAILVFNKIAARLWPQEEAKTP